MQKESYIITSANILLATIFNLFRKYLNCFAQRKIIILFKFLIISAQKKIIFHIEIN